MRDGDFVLGAPVATPSIGSGETAAGSATLVRGGLSVTFTAENFPGDSDPATAPYVYLDTRPDNRNPTTGGAGLGVCQRLTTSCGGEDEVSITLNELLIANFAQQVSLSHLGFSPENNQVLDLGIAETLVAISSDGGTSFAAFDQLATYSGSRFVFAVQSTALGFASDAPVLGGENGGREFYLRSFKAQAVPAPATTSLLAIALLGMGFAGAMRRRQAKAG
jgi:hypothetical protein